MSTTTLLPLRDRTSFRTPLLLEYIDGKRWRLTEGFEYHIGHLGSGEVVYVPAGAITDFASIPAPISWMWPPAHADYAKAAVIHDFLYGGGHVTRADGSVYRPTRQRADDIFKEGMGVLGCGFLKRRAIYRAVRMFGGRHYQEAGAGTRVQPSPSAAPRPRIASRAHTPGSGSTP